MSNNKQKFGACSHEFETQSPSLLIQSIPRKPLIVRIGHNYLDKTPLIGQIVDINMWDRWETINDISGIQLKVFQLIQNYPK